MLPSFRTQIAKYGNLRGGLLKAFFDLPVPPADAMRFEPVYFGFINITIILANESNSFHFSPSGSAVVAAEPSLDAHPSASGNNLRIPYWTEYFEIFRFHRRGHIGTCERRLSQIQASPIATHCSHITMSQGGNGTA